MHVPLNIASDPVAQYFRSFIRIAVIFTSKYGLTSASSHIVSAVQGYAGSFGKSFDADISGSRSEAGTASVREGSIASYEAETPMARRRASTGSVLCMMFWDGKGYGERSNPEQRPDQQSSVFITAIVTGICDLAVVVLYVFYMYLSRKPH